MAGIFVLKPSGDQFVFNLQAANGQVILSSERYTTRASARDGIESVRQNAAQAARFERLSSAAGEPYFVLKAANGQVIGRSETYSGNAAMENGIQSVMQNAPDARLEERQS